MGEPSPVTFLIRLLRMLILVSFGYDRIYGRFTPTWNVRFRLLKEKFLTLLKRVFKPRFWCWVGREAFFGVFRRLRRVRVDRAFFLADL